MSGGWVVMYVVVNLQFTHIHAHVVMQYGHIAKKSNTYILDYVLEYVPRVICTKGGNVQDSAGDRDRPLAQASVHDGKVN